MVIITSKYIAVATAGEDRYFEINALIDDDIIAEQVGAIGNMERVHTQFISGFRVSTVENPNVSFAIHDFIVSRIQ
jgi:hypothetical protein